MEDKVTLEDVVNLTPEALIKKLASQSHHQMDKQIAEVVAKPGKPGDYDIGEAKVILDSVTRAEANIEPAEVEGASPNPAPKFNLSTLRGYFPVGQTFRKDDTYKVGDFTLHIIGLIPSANRVKFSIEEEDPGTIHSMPFTDLTGQVNTTFPYKKGDKVSYDGQEYEVQRINPANANIVLNVAGKFKYVKVTKVIAV